MQIGALKRCLADRHPGVVAVIVCIVVLVCLCMARFGHVAGVISSSENEWHNYNNIEFALPHGSGTLLPVTGASARLEDSGHSDKQGRANAFQELFGIASNLSEKAETDEFSENAITPEELAVLKEQIIRERFGVIHREGKWIPTAGGGTNLVYITTGSLLHGRVGEAYDFQILATSGLPPYMWRVVGGALPAALALDTYAGRITGIPVEPTTTKFFMEVTDHRGAKDVAEYSLTIQPEQNLEITTASLPAACPGGEYLCQLQACGGVPPYAWGVEGNLAEIGSLVIDPHTGQLYGAIVDSVPSADIPLVFWVRDAQLQVSKELVLHVSTGLDILDVPELSARESEPFELALQATGGLEPYVWGVSGAIPPGLDFSSEGLFAGQPSQAGLYEINVWVRDGCGQLDTVQFALEVLPELADSISNFEALLSRNSVALRWGLPTVAEDLSVRIVRSAIGNPLTPSDGTTVYHGSATSYLDGDVGAGTHYYAAFLESNGMMLTSAVTPKICVKLPPETDPFADRVVSRNLLNLNAFRSAELPQIVLGAPRGKGLVWGSTDVVSLGAAINDDGGASAPYGGAITLEFVDNEVWDGPGADFTVFENVFYVCDESGVPDPETRFMEPAVVSVSQDGVNWRQFPIDFSPRYDPDSGELNLRHPYCYHSGFAGVNPVMSDGLSPDPTDVAVSGGDSFDISALGLEWIRYVRIQSTGSRWLIDDNGDLVCHNEETGAATRSNNKSGFDLDAVTAIWMQKVASQ